VRRRLITLGRCSPGSHRPVEGRDRTVSLGAHGFPSGDESGRRMRDNTGSDTPRVYLGRASREQ
jgi:hypothetical protein